MHFENTINLGEIIAACVFAGTLIKVALLSRDAQRDTRRDILDLQKCLGTREPPIGLLGDIHHIASKVEKHDRALERAGWLGDRRVGPRRSMDTEA